ncbi:hypothetical protein RBU49_00630 [Clostridium sp. MB40-C1]|uniref:immunoglobulin-like domain-containing protein n=1 Tax=Clostridium sp. MB40-C1 TaxID=3070996 RepID=UPI0027DF52F9|nr:immunoglobulin-like domain-containing protein [Clostridium sp. MB40-C1]WMJ80782.1 hypothetical protein RBU49_00630 [Clostridium sp. MB40-C1]
MFKKKLTAIITAALILGSSIPVLAQPKYVYLKSQSSEETIYINYKDYVKGYASRNKNFLETMTKYNISAISVKTPKGHHVIDFNGYVNEYKSNDVENVDDYSDKENSKKYTLPEKVKELHKDGSISSEEVVPPDNKKDDSTPILEARQKNDGEIVTIKGIVTSVIGNNAFVQDETGGIYIYLGPTANPNLISGNEVKVTGPLSTYNNLKQISNPKDNPTAVNINLESNNNKLPDAKTTTISGIKEEYQGTRVNIKNLTVLSISNPEKNGSYNVVVKDETGSISIRVDNNLNPKILASEFKVGSIIDVTSCLSRFKTDLQLMISNINEMKIISEGTGEIPSQDGVAINKIQGKSHKSPLEGQNVSKVKGIVTAISKDRYQNGFFMQNPNPDNDPATSEGIFVADKDTKVKVGDEVAVDGIVKEIVNGLQEDCVPETVIQASNVKTNSSGNKLPEPIKISFNEMLAKNIDNDNMTSFDIDEDAIDYYESLEGMLVEIEKPVIVGADERYGEICVLANDGEFSSHQRTKYGGIKAYKDDFNPEIITIDDVLKPIVDNKTKKFYDPNFKVSVGDKFNTSVVGVMSSGFGKYKVFNIDKLPEITPGNYEKEITSINKDESKLTVASFNVENLSKYSGERLQKIAESIVANLKSPDIVGLSEILDNDGETKSDVVDASQTYEVLINAIRKAGGPEYAYTDIAPINGQDGGVPGGNIRVGFIYVKDKVALVDKPKGDATTSVKMAEDGLSINPGRICPNDSAFRSSRKPLVAQFKYNGQDVFVIGNHLNSKRGDGSLFGMIQPPVRGSEPQRHKQAKLINDFVKEILNKQPDANVIALGDMNDYEFSETIDIIKGNEMQNAVDKLSLNERYSYVYNGNSQVLDNLLVSNNIYDKTEVDMVHINSQSTFEKLSDHDPILVQIELGKQQQLTDEEAVDTAIKNIKLGDTSKVTENLTLPTKGIYETTIQWESNKPEVVSNEGVVIRPENGQGNVEVTLTATVSKGKVTKSQEFKLTVLEKEKEEVNVEKELVKLDIGIPEGWQAADIPTPDLSKDKYLKLIQSTSCLITPTMDFTAYDNKTLTFDARTFGGVEQTSNEITVSISLDDGTTWEEVKKVSPVDKNMNNQTIDLTKYTGDKVKVKFETKSAINNKGVGIANIIIKGKKAVVPIVNE